MSNWLLVELHDLTREGHDAAMKAIILLAPGVRAVTDLSAISRATLDQWLLPPEQTWEYQRKHRNSRKKRQPDLL